MHTVFDDHVCNTIFLKDKELMNVYDFDGTIYNGDSTVDFYIYAFKHNLSLLRFVPKQLTGFILYMLKRIDKTRLKEYFFSFLTAINVEELVEDFWDKNQIRIYDWYLEQQKPDDIIISASPEFLLKPICKRLNINYLIASKVNANTGQFTDKNCHGSEKVRRLKAEYSITHIDEFYSDTHSDIPLAKIADKAFLVKKGQIKIWEATKT